MSVYRVGSCYCSRVETIIFLTKRMTSRSQWLLGLRRRYCGRSPVEIVGPNPAGNVDVFLLWVLCVVR